MLSLKLLLVALCFYTYALNAQEKRVLVISGGGARGAWGGGTAKALHEKDKPDYRCIVGNSTGALLAPLAAVSAYDRAEKGFTDVNQRTIFNVKPFDRDGEVVGWKAFIRILLKKKNLGESKNLKKRIYSFFDTTVYDQIKASGRAVGVTVLSLTTNKIAFKSTDSSIAYDDMVDWIWASANTPVFMSTLSKHNELWVDGGVMENVPIVEGLQYAKAHGIKRMDVIINYPLGGRPGVWPESGGITTIAPKMMRVIDAFSDAVRARRRYQDGYRQR